MPKASASRGRGLEEVSSSQVHHMGGGFGKQGGKIKFFSSADLDKTVEP